jgi:hypothetical protein
VKEATEGQANKIPVAIMQSLAIHMGNLEKALLAKDPEMPNHLRESHRLLITYPETVHLLDDVEINHLITAAEEYTKTKIVSEVAKGKGSRGKKEINAELDL